MITKNDCLTILVSLEDRGVNIDAPMKRLVTSSSIPMEVLKFILDNRGMEVANFYEMLRKKHNQKKSPLYHNIVKEYPKTFLLQFSVHFQMVLFLHLNEQFFLVKKFHQ